MVANHVRGQKQTSAIVQDLVLDSRDILLLCYRHLLVSGIRSGRDTLESEAGLAVSLPIQFDDCVAVVSDRLFLLASVPATGDWGPDHLSAVDPLGRGLAVELMNRAPGRSNSHLAHASQRS